MSITYSEDPAIETIQRRLLEEQDTLRHIKDSIRITDQRVAHYRLQQENTERIVEKLAASLKALGGEPAIFTPDPQTITGTAGQALGTG